MDSEECAHEWHEIEVYCEDCGSHEAVRCGLCDQVYDLVYSEDPREATDV